MSKITAHRIVTEFVATIATDSEPRSVLELTVAVLIETGGFSEDDAFSRAELMLDRVMNRLRFVHDRHIENGSFKTFAFNSSDDSFIQGVHFVEPLDDELTIASKQRRAQLLQVRETLRGFDAAQFERLCVAILAAFRPGDVHVTPYRSDQGLDFFAQVAWLPPMLHSAVDMQVFTRFKVWLIGQAKHYPENAISTPALRELIGSVELARAGAYSLKGDRYPDLRIRLCDPVYYLFFTTGDLSSESIELAKRSGMIVLDGFGVAELVAHLELGFGSDGRFDAGLLAGLLGAEANEEEAVMSSS